MRVVGRELDLAVVGGELMGAGPGPSGRYDIGVRDGKVERVERDIPPSVVGKVVDARGCIVLPGLVDLHTHLFPGGTYWGIDARPVAWRTGTTAWVDAGSAGAYNFGSFRSAVLGWPVHTWAFLNISPVGLVAETGEGRDIARCDPALCAATIEAHRDVLVGVKCRLDRAVVGEQGIELLDRALAAAGAAAVPVMVHIGAGPPAIDGVLDRLRPGDLVTHCTTGQSMALVDAHGRARPSARRARQRGVLFDVGHGSGAFCFAVAQALGREDFWPDIISSDLHQRSVIGPAFDLPTCVSKMLALGMPLERALAAATQAPAAAIGQQAKIGTLTVGGPADLAVFKLEEGRFALFDSYLERRVVDRLLVNQATLVAGQELGEEAAAEPAPWTELTPRQRALLGRSSPPGRRPWATHLDEEDCFVLLPTGPPLLGPRGPRQA
jgi:dihydroorotase